MDYDELVAKVIELLQREKQLDDLGNKRIIVHGKYSTALASAISYP